MRLLQYARHHSQLFTGIISSITFYKPLRDCFYYYHFTEEETEAQKVEVNGHGSFISKGIDHSLCLLDAHTGQHPQSALPAFEDTYPVSELTAKIYSVHSACGIRTWQVQPLLKCSGLPALDLAWAARRRHLYALAVARSI